MVNVKLVKGNCIQFVASTGTTPIGGQGMGG